MKKIYHCFLICYAQAKVTLFKDLRKNYKLFSWFFYQFLGLAKTSWTKKTPTSLLFLSFYFFNQKKRHGDLATVKLDKEYSLLGDRIYFKFFKKEIWITVGNYGWVDVTCCKWTQELIDSVWYCVQKGCFYIGRYGSNTVLNYCRETAAMTI